MGRGGRPRASRCRLGSPRGFKESVDFQFVESLLLITETEWWVVRLLYVFEIVIKSLNFKNHVSELTLVRKNMCFPIYL